jgi:hypothetical protein
MKPLKIQVLRESGITREAERILLDNLPPEKVVRLWASWQIGEGDYIAFRDRIFRDESVETLSRKIMAHQKRQSKIK